MVGLIERLWRILPAVRRSERSRTLFFTGLLMLVTAAETVGLAGSEALFLAELSAQALPGAFVIASIVTMLGSVLYAARVGVVRNDTIFMQMLLLVGIPLSIVPWFAPEPGAILLYGLLAVFYLSVGVFENHFWTFSGDYFDTLTSKRLVPVFTVGASVGGLLGGVIGAITASTLGPIATIGVWGAFLCASALMLRLARRPLRQWGPLEIGEADETSVAGMRGAIRYVRGSRLGGWLLVSSVGMVFALFVAQYIYSDIFVRAYPEPAELAIFIGVYLALTNLIEIALELWVTPWLIRRFGVASSHPIHPLLTLLSFGALLVQPILATAVAARANRELVDNAVAQPVRTLVFNALPPRFRGRIRAFLEGIVVYAGMSVAGIVLLVFESPDLRALSVLGGAAALLYLVANLGARRAYLRTLVEGLRSGRLDLEDLDTEIGAWEASRLAELCQELLRVETERPSRSLLQLIPSLGQRGIVAPLLEGLANPLASVRTRCAEALAGRSEALLALREALADPEAEVRLAAFRALPEVERHDVARSQLLSDPEARVRAAAIAELTNRDELLAGMLRSGERADRLAAVEVAGPSQAAELARCADDPDDGVRRKALERLADVAPEAEDGAWLERALAAEDPGVRSAALRLAARRADPAGLERIASSLGDPSALVRSAAAEALAARGEKGVEAALPYLSDPIERTAEAALQAVGGSEHPRRKHFLAGELRRRVGLAWAGVVGTTWFPNRGDLRTRFLHVATADALLRHRRLAFRALAHLASPRVVQNVQHALRFGGSRDRGDALEVLSNLGDREATRLLVLMHEPGDLDDRLAVVGAEVPVPTSGAAFLEEARRSREHWILGAVAADEASLGETGTIEAETMERLLALKRVPLFENLSLDQLDAVGQLARDVTFLPDEVIVREGELGAELYLLLDGSAEAWLDHGGPQARLLSTMGKGAYFGEMAILDGEPRSATVVSAERSHLLALDGESLKSLVMQMPEIAFELLRVMTSRVRSSERRLLDR